MGGGAGIGRMGRDAGELLGEVVKVFQEAVDGGSGGLGGGEDQPHHQPDEQESRADTKDDEEEGEEEGIAVSITAHCLQIWPQIPVQL